MYKKMNKYIDFILDLVTIENDIAIVDSDEVSLAKFIIDDDNKPAILLNFKKINNELDYVFTLTHEVRHFYQWLVVYDEDYFELEDERTRLIWKENFQKYTPVENSKKYTHQPLEVDAVCFTQLIISSIFGNKIIMDDFRKDDFIFVNKLKELSADYTQEEISEVMNMHEIKKIPTLS